MQLLFICKLRGPDGTKSVVLKIYNRELTLLLRYLLSFYQNFRFSNFKGKPWDSSYSQKQ